MSACNLQNNQLIQQRTIAGVMRIVFQYVCQLYILIAVL